MRQTPPHVRQKRRRRGELFARRQLDSQAETADDGDGRSSADLRRGGGSVGASDKTSWTGARVLVAVSGREQTAGILQIHSMQAMIRGSHNQDLQRQTNRCR